MLSSIKAMDDRIDDYIQGNMTEQERSQFEGDLKTDSSLREEYEMTRNLVEGIQAAGLKQLLKKEEASIRASELFVHKKYVGANDGSIDVAAASQMPNTVAIPFSVVMRRTISIAACLIVLFAGFIFLRTYHRMQSYGNSCFAELVSPATRGGNDLDSLLSSCYELIGKGELKEANAALVAARSIISDFQEAPLTDEITEYKNQIILAKQYEADWYGAIILMKQGRYWKAKSALKQVAASCSPYSNDATEILERLFNYKTTQQ